MRLASCIRLVNDTELDFDGMVLGTYRKIYE